jgi:hypothetical protein
MECPCIRGWNEGLLRAARQMKESWVRISLAEVQHYFELVSHFEERHERQFFLIGSPETETEIEIEMKMKREERASGIFVASFFSNFGEGWRKKYEDVVFRAPSSSPSSPLLRVLLV